MKTICLVLLSVFNLIVDSKHLLVETGEKESGSDYTDEPSLSLPPPEIPPKGKCPKKRPTVGHNCTGTMLCRFKDEMAEELGTLVGCMNGKWIGPEKKADWVIKKT